VVVYQMIYFFGVQHRVKFKCPSETSRHLTTTRCRNPKHDRHLSHMCRLLSLCSCANVFC